MMQLKSWEILTREGAAEGREVRNRESIPEEGDGGISGSTKTRQYQMSLQPTSNAVFGSEFLTDTRS